jgi:hypothetical protein
MLTEQDTPYSITSVGSLQHKRSHKIINYIQVDVTQLWHLYKLYEDQFALLMDFSNTSFFEERDVFEQLCIWGSASILYYELSLRETLYLPSPTITTLPIIMNGALLVLEGVPFTTMDRDDLPPAYFKRLADTTYKVYCTLRYQHECA